MGDKIDTPQRPTDERQVVRGIDKNGKFIFDQVGIEELNYRGRFGALATSGTENDISIGEHIFVLNLDDAENSFRIGDDVLVTPIPSHGGCCMWAEIIAKDTDVEPCRVTVHVEDVSNIVGTFNNWELQVVARPKFGITKDTSASSVDPTAAGPFTITVTAGKFFPIGGKLLMIPLAARQIALVGLVKSYSGNSLVVEKNSTNATVSTAYTSWAIALLDAPQNAAALNYITGLHIAASTSDSINDVNVSPGVIRDSTDTIDLELTSDVTKRLDAAWSVGSNGGAAVQSGNLVGTISSVGTAVTGTSASFFSDFKDGFGASSLLDYVFQVSYATTSIGYVAAAAFPYTPNFDPIIYAGSATSRVTAVADNTHLTTAINLGAAGSTYKRGGPASGAGTLTYAIVLVRKDTDGSIDVIACSSKGGLTGGPDLPSGYTYYRVLGIATWSGGATPITVFQPLHAVTKPSQMYFDGTVSGLSANTVKGALDELAAEKLDATAALFFKTIAVSGQSNVVADSATDTLTLAAGNGITLTTNASTDTVTVAAAATGTNTGDETGPGILAKLAPVDGAGSGLDADLLDGNSSVFFATAASVSALPVLDSNTYTPTVGTLTNLDSSPTAGSFEYLRVGSIVTVSGNFLCDPTTAAGTVTSFRFTNPITTAFTAATQAHGVCTVAGTTAGVGHVESVNGTGNCLLQFNAALATAQQVYVVYTYRII